MMKLIFFHADKRESLLQIGTVILMGMVKHSQSSHNSKFAMSLQFLKKEVRNRVHFLHADKYQIFYKLGLSFFDKSGQTCLKYPEREVGNILQYIKKKLLLVSLHSQTAIKQQLATGS